MGKTDSPYWCLHGAGDMQVSERDTKPSGPKIPVTNSSPALCTGVYVSPTFHFLGPKRWSKGQVLHAGGLGSSP